MYRMKALFGIACLAAMAGCASTDPTHYYTLLPEVDPTLEATDLKSQRRPSYAVEVERVAIPELVERPQIVITDPDSAQVIPLNDYLWASPLADEVRNAVSDLFSRRTGVLVVTPGDVPESLPLWRVSLTIQRFESFYGRRALVDATWRLTQARRGGSNEQLICRGEVRIPVSDGMSSMVLGHREALKALTETMVRQIEKRSTEEVVPAVQLKGCTS